MPADVPEGQLPVACLTDHCESIALAGDDRPDLPVGDVLPASCATAGGRSSRSHHLDSVRK